MPSFRNPEAFVVYVDRDIRRRAFDVTVINHTAQKIFTPGMLVDVRDDIKQPPCLSLDFDAAQDLMNELWRLGVRPTDVGTAGQLQATVAHLDDMRKIVFEHFLKAS